MTKINSKSQLIVCCSLLFSLVLINYLDRVALSLGAKDIAAEFHLSPIQMGYFFSSFLWSYALCLIPSGMITDRHGSKVVAGGGIAVWSLATMATGASTGLISIVVSRLAMGAGEATSYPAASRLIRENIPEENRGFATAIFNSGVCAGPAFGAILISWLISMVGWRLSFVISGGIGFIWLALWLLFFKRAGLNASRQTPASNAPDAPRAASTPLRELFRSSSLWGTSITQGLCIYTLYLFLTWLPNYLQTAKGMNIQQAGIFTALPYIGAVVFSIALGKLSDRLLKAKDVAGGRRRPMIAVMMLAAALIVFTPFVNNLWLMVALFATALTGISTAAALNMALTNDLLVNQNDAGTANSIVVLGGNIFGIAAPIATGYIISATGSYDYAFVLAGVLLLAGAVISQIMTRAPIGASPSHQILQWQR